jgi:hypothetical protein
MLSAKPATSTTLATPLDCAQLLDGYVFIVHNRHKQSNGSAFVAYDKEFVYILYFARVDSVEKVFIRPGCPFPYKLLILPGTKLINCLLKPNSLLLYSGRGGTSSGRGVVFFLGDAVYATYLVLVINSMTPPHRAQLSKHDVVLSVYG